MTGRGQRFEATVMTHEDTLAKREWRRREMIVRAVRQVRPNADLPGVPAPRRSTPTTTPSMMSGSSRRLTRMGSKSSFSGSNQTVGPSCL